MSTDPAWCYENPKTAAGELDAGYSRIAELENLLRRARAKLLTACLEKEHHEDAARRDALERMIAEINAALTRL